MNVTWLTADTVREIHNYILEPDQLQGEDSTRTIESAITRVQQQVHYNHIDPDILQIAATYAVVISRSHSFADGNKRTAMISMIVFLDNHGYGLDVDGESLALWMEECAAGDIDDQELWSLIFEHLSELEQESICENCGVEPVEHYDTTLCIGCETILRHMDKPNFP